MLGCSGQPRPPVHPAPSSSLQTPLVLRSVSQGDRGPRLGGAPSGSPREEAAEQDSELPTGPRSALNFPAAAQHRRSSHRGDLPPGSSIPSLSFLTCKESQGGSPSPAGGLRDPACEVSAEQTVRILPGTRPSPGRAAHPGRLPWSPWHPGPCPRAVPRGGPPCAGHSLHALPSGPPGGPAPESLSPTSQRQRQAPPRGPELAGWGFPAKGRCSKHRGVTCWGSRVQPLGKLCVHSWILKRVRDRPLGKSRLRTL